MNEALPWISIAIAIAGPLVVFLIGDSKSKAKAEDAVLKVKALETATAMLGERIVRSEQDRIAIHVDVERLRVEKASKEMLDGMSNTMRELRIDMDKRFDRLEALVRGPRA